MRSVAEGERLRLVVIGAGKMGEAHLAAFSGLTSVEVVGVASRTPDSAKRLANAHGVAEWDGDWRELCDRTHAHACVVAVSHLAVAPVSEEVLKSRLHLLAEKPVHVDHHVVQRLATKAAEHGVVAMVGVNRRFYASVGAAVDVVRYHGDVTGVSVVAPDPVRPYRALGTYDRQVYDHWLIFNTVHAVDLLRMVGGPVSSMSVAIRPRAGPVDRSVAATLLFESGCVGTFSSHGGYGGMAAWQLIVHGVGVEARLAPLERGELRIGDAVRALPMAAGSSGVRPGLREQARAFVEAVAAGRVPAPGSDMADHAETVRLAAALQDDRPEDPIVAAVLA